MRTQRISFHQTPTIATTQPHNQFRSKAFSSSSNSVVALHNYKFAASSLEMTQRLRAFREEKLPRLERFAKTEGLYIPLGGEYNPLYDLNSLEGIVLTRFLARSVEGNGQTDLSALDRELMKDLRLSHPIAAHLKKFSLVSQHLFPRTTELVKEIEATKEAVELASNTIQPIQAVIPNDHSVSTALLEFSERKPAVDYGSELFSTEGSPLSVCKFPTVIQSSKYLQNSGRDMQMMRYPTRVDIGAETKGMFPEKSDYILFLSQQTPLGRRQGQPLVILSATADGKTLPTGEQREEILQEVTSYLKELLKS